MASIEEVLGTDIAHKSDFILTSTGDLDIISGLANLKNALFHRLVTTPGTLIHRPNYGVGIEDYQNSLAGLENQRSLAKRIQEQFELDPRVNAVTGVLVNVDDLRPDRTEIVVRLSVTGYDEVSTSFVPFGEGV